MPEPQHFSDYGFDPQIDYFQVLEEARKYKRETARSLDAFHFKLQKPISKEDSNKKHNSKRKKRWWRNALLFFKCKWTHNHHVDHNDGLHRKKARAIRGSISGPVYVTESMSESTTPYRTMSRPSSGPLAGSLTPAKQDEVAIPYLNLRELNMEEQHRFSTSARPIYLVT